VTRRELGGWIKQTVPIDVLVPETAMRWRPLVEDAIAYIFTHISKQRIAAKLQEQLLLPLETPAEMRLLRLISRMPGLQKMGQVVARNRRIPVKLREALSQLENGMSDVTAPEIHAIIQDRLGDRLERYAVKLAPEILSEASVSAVVRFSWGMPERERQEGVFKVLKPYVPAAFAEDMKVLQELGEYLAGKGRKYGFAVHEVRDTLEEVRLLLAHELDFSREQTTLGIAARMYRSSFGIRVPRLIPELCAEGITAMSAEAGVKVTEAARRAPIRRERIAAQIVEALIAVPFFAWEDTVLFHADPHAGNLLYDEPNRELVVLDWALAEQLDRESRRQLVLLAAMTILRDREGVSSAIEALARDRGAETTAVIRRHVEGLFAKCPKGQAPGVLDAMMLLDAIALDGVHFPPALFLFRKVLFTLEGVLHDVAGHDVRIDQVVVREFLARAAASFGLFHAPLKGSDFLKIERDALWYPVRRWRAVS
jgi:predicted unusual protein kinase regulating ubiquinone biosynthesis (AarF/ABC1/UbiB family)